MLSRSIRHLDDVAGADDPRVYPELRLELSAALQSSDGQGHEVLEIHPGRHNVKLERGGRLVLVDERAHVRVLMRWLGCGRGQQGDWLK